MSTDPSQVQLSPEQQRFLADVADQAGKPWTVVLSEALGQYRVQYAENSGPAKSQKKARFGSGQGLLSMADDFDAPLADMQDYSE